MSGTQSTSDQPMPGGFLNDLAQWATTPLVSQVNVGTLALFFVLILCVCILWTRVLRNIVHEVVEEIDG
jgi:hypothetical protein